MYHSCSWESHNCCFNFYNPDMALLWTISLCFNKVTVVSGEPWCYTVCFPKSLLLVCGWLKHKDASLLHLSFLSIFTEIMLGVITIVIKKERKKKTEETRKTWLIVPMLSWKPYAGSIWEILLKLKFGSFFIGILNKTRTQVKYSELSTHWDRLFSLSMLWIYLPAKSLNVKTASYKCHFILEKCLANSHKINPYHKPLHWHRMLTFLFSAT